MVDVQEKIDSGSISEFSDRAELTCRFSLNSHLLLDLDICLVYPFNFIFVNFDITNFRDFT